MKLFKLTTLTLFSVLLYNYTISQNILINVLTQNAGVVRMGESGKIEIKICNTSSVLAVPAYKIRPQISIPLSLVNIPDSGHVLPEGWSIISKSDGVFRLTNGTDQISPNDCRTILLTFTGVSKGGPFTVSGNILFSNGLFPGNTSGPPTQGDNPADNSSSSTCEVIK